VTSFELMQQASERGGAGLVYFALDLLEIEGENLTALPLSERKSRLASLLTKPPNGIKFSDHVGGDGEAFRRAAYRHGLEGLVGWSDPEGTRPFLGSLLLGFHGETAGCYMRDASALACLNRPSPTITVASSR
jgi:hypothetical protein